MKAKQQNNRRLAAALKTAIGSIPSPTEREAWLHEFEFMPGQTRQLTQNELAALSSHDQQTIDSTMAYMDRCEHWVSGVYHVALDKHTEHGFGKEVEVWHLSIKRHDREPIGDWRVLQRIKSEIVGQETEALELYPAESRVVDTANQYHLYAFPGAMIPVGFPKGMRTDNPNCGKARQGTATTGQRSN